MTQFTLINSGKNLDKLLPVGTLVKAVQAKDNSDAKSIRAYMVHDSQEEVGYIGTSSLIAGSESNVVLYDKMKDAGLLQTGIELIVVGHSKQWVGNARKVERVLALVEIKDEKGAKNAMGNSTEQGQKFELSCIGSTHEYPGKRGVLLAFNKGIDTVVGLEVQNEKIIVMNGKEPASEIDKKSDDYDLAYKVVATLGKVTATAKKPGNSAFMVEFEVDAEQLTYVETGKKVLTIQDVMEDKKSIVGAREIKKIHKYLQDAGLSSKQIMKVMQTYRKYPKDVEGRIPRNPDVLYKDEEGLIRKTVIYLSHGKHLRLEGEKGTGKNLMTSTLAWIYQRPLYELSLNSQTDKLDLLGSKTFVEGKDKSGEEVKKIGFQKEAMVEAMENGGFLNLDEVNTADPSVLVLLHSIVDDRGSLEVPGLGRVVADKNFGIILTMNKGYIGTNELNEATLDRFTSILFPSPKSIGLMLKERVKTASASDINLADRVYKDIKNLVDNNELSEDCRTVRGFIVALEVSEDIGLNEALIDNVANGIQDDDYRNVVINIIDSIVTK